MTILFVRVGVAARSPWVIYFFIATSSVASGTLFISGSVSSSHLLNPSENIFINLDFWREINSFFSSSYLARRLLGYLDLAHLLDNVKFMYFAWLKAKMLTFAFSYTNWWRHPLLCVTTRFPLFSF